MTKLHYSNSDFPCVKLKNLTEINIGKTPSRKVQENFGLGSTWVSISDINNVDKFIGSSKEQITEEGIKSSNIKIVNRGTILFSYKLSIGKVAITDRDLYTNEAIAALPIKDESKVFKNYLFYVLRHFDFTGRSDKAAKGKTLNKAKLKNLQIPLPPLPVQKRIAAILDKADELRQKDQQVIHHYEQLSQSLFLDMFGDPVTNPKGWEVGTIRDVAKSVKYGTSKKASTEGKFIYLRMNNIDYNGNMNYNSLKYIDLEPKQIEKYNTKKGDILFNRTNSKELVGKTGLIKDEPEMILAGYLIRLRVNSRVNPYFLWKHLNSKWAKQTLNHMCKNIVGMANINAQELQDIATLIPPISLQNKFADQVQAIEQQKQQAEQAARHSEELFQSLLQRAFKGELVKEEQVT